ncbi:class I SAM-dependent methyltransferase [Salinarimonas rosea]|uniref:class I SAM-dependent methyltransferase n=1 Tax=Salinarimonas rosea TaxID=552063 RepID=UPI00048AED71|nr:class I SAM-dependent methyltransferase [Salinarimonas rosea]
MHPRLRTILAERRLDPDAFAAACRRASEIVGTAGLPSTRMRIAAALMSVPGGRVCDVGGGVSLYPLVARLMGTEVTVVDALRGWEGDVRPRVEALSHAGIRFVEADVETMRLPENAYDAVVAFETIEHLPHSPRPVLEKMVGALVPGGRLCLSVPNIARLDMRLRLLGGRSPHENVVHFFREGTPFHGHHREYTLDELRWIAGELGLVGIRGFGVNVTYESRKPKSALQRLLLRLDDGWGLGDRLLPHRLRHHAWLEATKPGAGTEPG